MQNILSEQTDQRDNTEFFIIFCQDVIWKRKFRACKVMEIIFSISVFQIFGHKLGKPDNITNFQSWRFRVSYSKTDVVVVCL